MKIFLRAEDKTKGLSYAKQVPYEVAPQLRSVLPLIVLNSRCAEGFGCHGNNGNSHRLEGVTNNTK